MRWIAFILSLTMLSCSASMREQDLGSGFSITYVRDGLGIIYLNKKRVIRGGIKILLDNNDLIFGYIDADDDDFKDVKGVHDRTGYFLIDKKNNKISNIDNFKEMDFK